MFKEQAFGLVAVNGTKACALGIHRCSPESAYGGAEIIRCGIFRSCVNDRFMPPVNSVKNAKGNRCVFSVYLLLIGQKDQSNHLKNQRKFFSTFRRSSSRIITAVPINPPLLPNTAYLSEAVSSISSLETSRRIPFLYILS